MDQGVLGWVFAVVGVALWVFEGYKIITRQRLENEKMKELLSQAILAMQHLYQAHENALRFYRDIVATLVNDKAGKMKKSEYVVINAQSQSKEVYADPDPVMAIKKALAGGARMGTLCLNGFFTAPRSVPHGTEKALKK